MVGVRDAGLHLIVFASITAAGQVARADPSPEDPYVDVTPSPVMTSEALHAAALYLPSEPAHAFQPAARAPEVAVATPAPARVSNPTITPSAILDPAPLEDEWYERPEVQIGGGAGAGLLLLGLWLRGRRLRRRRALRERDRKTQFGMSAVDPTLAKINVAAWERGPAIMPIAIGPEMLHNGRAPRAPSAPPAPSPAPVAAPPVAAPYRHYSAADLAAYGMGASNAAARPVAAPAPSAPAARAVAKPVMMPHLMPSAPLPQTPPAPAPRGSWHPTVLPWDPQAQGAPHHHHARAVAPSPSPRLAAGTPPPPLSNPQPFVGLPAAHRPLPGLPPHAPTMAAPPPQSFVLEMSSTELPEAQSTAHYPLTFPAFPEAAGATALAPIEPSGLNRWGASTEVEAAGDFEVRFARGSQPAPHLDPLRMTLPHASADAETRIARAPTRPPARTLGMPRPGRR